MPNTQDLIVWVHDPTNNPQNAMLPIAIKVNINVFDTPKCIETNPYFSLVILLMLDLILTPTVM